MLVSWRLFDVLGSDPDSQVVFHSEIHLKFFNVILNDFLSETDREHSAGKKAYLASLRCICDQPNFDVDNSVSKLRVVVSEFTAWLQHQMTIDAWFPCISTKAHIPITRFQFIKICGNVSKHNTLRTFRVAKELNGLLAGVGVTISNDQAMMALDDFYEQFHEDILVYHGTTIVEFLNNLQWAIYEYLLPEYRRSYTKDPEDRYRYWYLIPDAITDTFAKSSYWQIMNKIRREPNVGRFQGSKWSKLRH